MKKMEETMKKKYVCERAITVTRLEDLLQDAAVGININFHEKPGIKMYSFWIKHFQNAL